MTAPDLDSLAALLDKATPGPWRAVHCQHGGMLLQRDDAERAHIQSSLQIVPAEDATLIVAAVNALPALIAYVLELESLVERMARSDSNVAIAMRERCAQLLNITRSDAQLMAGDMTAGEWRTVSAVLRNRAAAIRALEV